MIILKSLKRVILLRARRRFRFRYTFGYPFDTVHDHLQITNLEILDVFHHTIRPNF